MNQVTKATREAKKARDQWPRPPRWPKSPLRHSVQVTKEAMELKVGKVAELTRAIILPQLSVFAGFPELDRPERKCRAHYPSG